MKYENVHLLRKELIGKRVTAVECNGAHGMVLCLTLSTLTGEISTVDIATYDDGKKHDVDEFYVSLNGAEL